MSDKERIYDVTGICLLPDSDHPECGTGGRRNHSKKQASFRFGTNAFGNGKTVFQKTVVRICDLDSVESELRKGDKIISDDCFFYTFRLKDGTSITVSLYAYGKEAEKEILETIQGNLE